MEKNYFIFRIFTIVGVMIFASFSSAAQSSAAEKNGYVVNGSRNRFLATAALLDASISSLNSLNSLIKKENYRNKITALNNPATRDLGFSLEGELQNALKPILDKTKSINTQKFSGVVSSMINTHPRDPFVNTSLNIAGLFSSLISLVGNMTITEKKVTRQDLDTFMLCMSRYFAQFEKLELANRGFDQHIERLSHRLRDLQFDIRELIFDLITIAYPSRTRNDLKSGSLEELFLQYLEQEILSAHFISDTTRSRYPGDGIKTSKEIVHGIQKLFAEYQKVYAGNYNEIKTILLQSRTLGKNINLKQVDASLEDLQQLFNESKDADILNLRLNTLAERLRLLVTAEQLEEAK